jgi:two-component system, LuxR family, response regulator FixJ
MQGRVPLGFLLLVDDDPHLLGALRFAFEAEGYDVSTFGSGEELLASAHPRANCCIVIDERLPGITGLETVARLRDAGVDAPAILVTTHPSVQVARRAAAANVEIVEKPLLDGGLAQKVSAVLAAHGSPKAHP